MSGERFSRNTALFGVVGQNSISTTPVVVVGLGGLGSHVAQQLAYLGVERFLFVDPDRITESSLNRVIGAIDRDVADRTFKTVAAERLARSIRTSVAVQRLEVRVEDPQVDEVLPAGSVVFGCLDSDSARLALLDKCSARRLPVFDLASDTDTNPRTGKPTYGGRVLLNRGDGCLVCLGVLDHRAMAEERMSTDQLVQHQRLYGVDIDGLDGTGPAVVSLNGAVASLAVTEFMHLVTGMVEPERQLLYYGEKRVIRKSLDTGSANCLFCSRYRGESDQPSRFVTGASEGEIENASVGDDQAPANAPD